ncbi:toll/interleukin-1 receptor domain-containing protein, partial [Prescottella equi]
MGWVQQLAARLVRDGVDVTLDQWDLKAGLNLNLFMESGLTESDRVLVVSSSNYVTKANGRTGG